MMAPPQITVLCTAIPSMVIVLPSSGHHFNGCLAVSVHHLKLLSSAIPSMVIVFPIQWVSVSDIRPGSIFNAVESDARKSFKSKLVERQRLLSVSSSIQIVRNGCTDRVVPVSEFEVHY